MPTTWHMVQVPAIAATAWEEMSGASPLGAAEVVGSAEVVGAAEVVGSAEVVGAAEVVVVGAAEVVEVVGAAEVVVVVVFLLEQPAAARDKTKTVTSDSIITLFLIDLLLLKLSYCITSNTGGQYVV